MAQNTQMLIVSPCVSVCKIGDDGLCIGCHRTVEEIREWRQYTSDQRIEIMRRLGYGKRIEREKGLRGYDRG
jgi:predicted Fe-S protein YdhL (DUF1289 family)